MPNGKDDPAPENTEVEIDALLASFVDLWVEIYILIVDVLLERVGEETGPGGP